MKNESTSSSSEIIILIAGGLVAIGFFIAQFFKPAQPKVPQSPESYTEAQLIGLIRYTGDRCKEPAVVTPTQIPNGTKYLIACYANTGTYEITITSGSEPSIKKLKFN